MFSCALPLPLSPLGLFDRDCSQSNALDGGPDDGQATHLRGKHVNLVGPLPNEASETLDGVGGPDGAVQRLRKVVKGEGLVFLLYQSAHCLWREFTVLGECSRPVVSRRPL
jgi:hypothetical protein